MKIDFISDINKDAYESLRYGETDKYFVKVLWWQFAVFALYSIGIYLIRPAVFYPSPFSWRIINLTETLTAILIGCFTALLMMFLRGRLKNHYFYRFLMANALITYSYLFVFISGGSIEMHFHFFIMFAAIVLYYDWRLGWWAIIAVALHHGILNFVAPNWVYFYGRNDFSFVSHALLVLAMAIFTTKLAESGKRAIAALHQAKKELENVNSVLEVKVKERTTELQDKVSELQNLNQMTVDRELTVLELKKEIEVLKNKNTVL